MTGSVLMVPLDGKLPNLALMRLAAGDNQGGSCICCTSCLASGNVEFGRKENFVSNWNRRTPIEQPEPSTVSDGALREALEAAVRDLETTYEAAKCGKPIEVSIGQFGRLARMREALRQTPPVQLDREAVARIICDNVGGAMMLLPKQSLKAADAILDLVQREGGKQ